MLSMAILLPIVGLAVGSFTGLVSLRLPVGRGVVSGRSACVCGRTLGPLDLLPVISFVLKRGLCDVCKEPIPRRYPLMELGCAGIGLWAALGQSTVLAAVVTALLGWQLLLLAVIDGENFWLPDVLTWPLALSGLVANSLIAPDRIVASCLGIAFGYASLALLRSIYRKIRGRQGLGGGDPFMFAAGGAWVGWMGLPTVLLWAAAAGLSVAFAIKVGGRNVTGATAFPFGVFLATGVWLTWFYGPFGL